MLQVKIAHAFPDIPMVNAGMDFFGKGVKTLATRGDF
jgi:hypothetical protein